MPRATNAVGRNVLRKEGASKVVGRRAYIDDLSFPGTAATARTIRSTIPAGEITAHPLRLRHRRLHHRRLPRHSRPQHRRADRGRPAVPRRARDPPRRRADPAARARGSRDAARGRRADRLPRRRRRSTIRERRRRVVQDDRDRQGRRRRTVSRSPTSSSKASTATGHQEQLYIEPNGVIAVPGNGVPDDRGITVYGSMQCPVLRAPRADGAARAARRQGARRADRDRRRLRRQGRISVDDRRATRRCSR